jgi:small subunit ribosomal protein S20
MRASQHFLGDDSVPNTPARKKQIRQDEHRRARNRWRKRVIKECTKEFLDAIQDRNVEGAETAFRAVQKELDKVSTTSTIHKNLAARRKSRMSRRLRDLKTAVAG